jgi:acetone carboxylase gamma subunit
MRDRLNVSEYLAVDLASEMWVCRPCGHVLISARENFKKGCLLYDRDPAEIHQPQTNGEYDFTPDPAWCRYIEFYCPSCGTMIECEPLPPGHPVTYDIELDIDALKRNERMQDETVSGGVE